MGGGLTVPVNSQTMNPRQRRTLSHTFMAQTLTIRIEISVTGNVKTETSILSGFLLIKENCSTISKHG
jgi:hypothetical protein